MGFEPSPPKDDKIKIHYYTACTEPVHKACPDFLVIFADYPGVVEAIDKQAIPKKAASAAAYALKDVKITGEKSIQIGGHPGIEFVLEGEQKGNGKDYIAYWRYYVRGNRVYQLAVVADAPIGVATRKKFFDSFELLGK